MAKELVLPEDNITAPAPMGGGPPAPQNIGGMGGYNGLLNITTPDLPNPQTLAQSTTPSPGIQVNGVSSPVPESVEPLSIGQQTQQSSELLQNQMGAEGAKATANSEKAQRDAIIEGNLAAQGKAAQNEMLHWQGAFETAHANALQQDQSALKEAASMKVDPDHWWNQHDTGGKIAASIGLILGGIGQGMAAFGPHGNKNATNMAIDEMDKAINRDIDSQKENIKNKWEVYKNQHALSDSQDNFNKFKILDSQSQYMLGQKVALDQLTQSAAQAADPIAKANGQIAIDALKQRIVDEERAWGAHNEALAQTQQAKIAAYQKDQLDRARALQDKAIQQAADLEKIKAETGKAVVVAGAEAPSKEFQTQLTALSNERAKLQEQIGSYGGDWTHGRTKAAMDQLADVNKREADLIKQHSGSAAPEKTSPSAANGPSGLPPRK